MLKKKPVLAALLSAALVFSVTSVGVLAAGTDIEAPAASLPLLEEAAPAVSVPAGETSLPADGDAPDAPGESAPMENASAEMSADAAGDTAVTLPKTLLGYSTGPEDGDAYLAEYIRRQFYNEAAMSESYMPANEATISGVNKQIYEAVAEAWRDVANGDRAATTVEFTAADLGLKQYYTADDLGIDIVINGNFNKEAVNRLLALCQIDFTLITEYLRAGCAYELYWFNTAIGHGYQGLRYTSNKIDLTGFSLFLYAGVGPNYQPADYNQEEPTVDTGLIKTSNSLTARAVANAHALAADAAGLSDYEKLSYYKEQICGLVSYNTAAAAASADSYVDKNPWALVYVFDGDPSTNVVCEGYSEAFQYLCELTSFSDPATRVYSVTGHMTGGTGAGGHKWNIVHIGGKNYLADITNSDSGAIGQGGGLFLNGVTGSCATGYIADIPGQGLLTFEYDEGTMMVYTEEELTLSDTDYSEPAGNTVAITGISLRLTDMVGLNVSVTSTAPLASSDKMVFSYAGQTVDIPVSQAAVSDAKYTFTLPLYAKQMTEEVTFYVVAGDTAYPAETWSVRDYAQRILDGDYDDATKDLVRAMLSYGACAQTYFGYRADDLADAFIGDQIPDSDPDLSACAYTLDRAADTKGFHLQSATLILDEAVAVKFYYTKDDAEKTYDFSILENENLLSEARISHQYDAEAGLGCLIVSGIRPHRLDDVFTLTVKDGADTVTTLSYSPFSYCHTKLTQADTDQALKNLCKAIVNYCEKAKAYV